MRYSGIKWHALGYHKWHNEIQSDTLRIPGKFMQLVVCMLFILGKQCDENSVNYLLNVTCG